MIRTDKVTVENTPSGGIKIFIDDVESDSLAIIEVKRHPGQFGILSLRAGLRGNFSMARNRGLRWISTYMDAPDVSEPERLRRKARALERGGRAIKG